MLTCSVDAGVIIVDDRDDSKAMAYVARPNNQLDSVLKCLRHLFRLHSDHEDGDAEGVFRLLWLLWLRCGVMVAPVRG